LLTAINGVQINLQTRYYDPVVGRFLNADIYVSTGQEFLGWNMFVYCLNNPVMYEDHNGEAGGSKKQRVEKGGIGRSGGRRTSFGSQRRNSGGAGNQGTQAGRQLAGARNAAAMRTASIRAITQASRYNVKPKHLPTSGQGFSQFNTSNQSTIRGWIQTALRNGRIQANGSSADSFRIVHNMNRAIGTRGERYIRVVFDRNGRIITAFPQRTATIQ